MADSEQKTKVSIIVPIYGVEKYLNECVDSILNQTLREIEVILVDDGSKDRCPEIVDEYAARDSRVVAVHQPNGGYGCAVNHGMKVATGEYIGIVESDDWIEPTMYENLYSKALETEADVVKSDFFYYWSDNGINMKASLFPENIANQTICPRKSNGKQIFSLTPSIWTALYKRDFLRENNISFLETPGASYQDTAFNFKVYASATKIHFLDRAFVHYRQDNENSSVKNTGKVYALFDEYDSVRSFLKENGLWEDTMISIYLRTQSLHWMWHLDRVSASLRCEKQFVTRIQQELKLLSDDISDFPEVFGSVHPHPFLLGLYYHPRLTRFIRFYCKRIIKLNADERFVRVKFLGVRVFKKAY